MTCSIEQNLAAIQRDIRLYETRYHRPAGSVHLLAATKNQSIENIKQALHAGQTCFGENYLQEALPKIEALKNQPTQIKWHFIGAIQSNKTKKIAEHFSWVHCVDDINIARRLNNQRPAHLPPLNICLEINISEEKTKSGILADQAYSLAIECEQFSRLKCRGLMAIPAPKMTLHEQRVECHKLLELKNSLAEKNIFFDTLSMGMSQDLEAAIAEGATLVRIGTNIFGKRV
jgi:pyridoxal phosphate enzyme (YggS family)